MCESLLVQYAICQRQFGQAANKLLTTRDYIKVRNFSIDSSSSAKLGKVWQIFNNPMGYDQSQPYKNVKDFPFNHTQIFAGPTNPIKCWLVIIFNK